MDKKEQGGVLPAWVAAVVAAGALLLITGAVLALAKPSMFLGPGDAVTGGVRVYAGYLFSRNLALAVLLIAALTRRWRANLPGLIALYALIQLLDAIVDCAEARWMVLPPVVLLGLLFAWAWLRLNRAESEPIADRR